MGRPRKAMTHGSYLDYQRHRRRKEVPCRPCVTANARKSTTDRGRGRCAAGLGWPLLAAAELGPARWS